MKSIGCKESLLGYNAGGEIINIKRINSLKYVFIQEMSCRLVIQDTLQYTIKFLRLIDLVLNEPLKGISEKYTYKNITEPQSVFYGIMWFIQKIKLSKDYKCCDNTILKKAIENYNGSKYKKQYAKDVWTGYEKERQYNYK
ncbi:hypothetical protein AAEX28_01635 [Lentisphaerota bacterium WC36G]|nr:hypothetical protein LJT99_04520 [Lentisphaerae bacterium WC36]